MSNHPPSPRSFVDVVVGQGQAVPGKTAFRYMVDGDVVGEQETRSFGELLERARAIGTWLQARQAQGQRVLLLYPPGLDFIDAFLGCLFAGAIAVPAYPPDPARPERSLARLADIVADCDARFVFTTGWLQAILAEAAPSLAGLTWLATDALDPGGAAAWQAPVLDGGATAFLQYTSGSTAAPKGVVVSHGNLLHNTRSIREAFAFQPTEVGVSWLPTYHDMGLIGKVLNPIALGATVTLMSPIAFLQRPMRWLEAISHFGASASGGPNFAYDLCARKATDAEVAALDLSGWTKAICGAEPVRAGTLARFAERFGPAGFKAGAFLPAYGLAEATLLVTGSPRPAGPQVLALRPADLERHLVVPAAAGAEAREVVACGTRADLEVRIVHPEQLEACAADQVGEVWVRGASVAQGYWQRPEESAATFGAYMRTGEGPYLRTGDLGFFHGDALVITGRRKDLLILRGKNHYPQDLEQTVEQAHAAIRPGCVAAFAVEHEAEERLVVVAEAADAHAGELAEVGEAVRAAIAASHGVAVHAIAFLAARSVPKTSSGKIQRRACRDGYLGGTLDELGRWPALAAPAVAPALLASPRDQAGWEAWLGAWLARATGLPAVAPDQPLAALGLDSLASIELAMAIEGALGAPVGPGVAWQAGTVAALAARLAAGQPEPLAPIGPAADTSAPSAAQRRLYVLDRLLPGSARYNLQVGVTLPDRLDVAALRRALDALVERHEALRTTLAEGPIATLQPAAPVELPQVHLTVFSAKAAIEAGKPHARELAERPFDLARGPLLRARLLTFNRMRHVLLLAVHHLAVDGWSLGVLRRELIALYDAFAAGKPSPLAPVAVRYADYAAWQASRDLEAERRWWRAKLAGLEPLPLGCGKPPVRPRTAQGATVAVELPAAVAGQLRRHAKAAGTSLFVALAASFAAVLHRYHGQDAFALGTLVAGRERPELRDLVGLCVNPLVLRCDLAGTPSFAQLVARMRATVVEALDHQALPFEEVVAAAGALDRSGLTPLIQACVAVAYQVEPHARGWKPVMETPDGAPPGGAKFDLSLIAAEKDDRLACTFEYSTDLFDAPFMAALAAHWQALLQAMLAAPHEPVAALPLLAPAEEARVLALGGGPLAIAPPAPTIHALIEAQAARTPGAIAVSDGATQLTYAALDQRAEAVAAALQALGVGLEERVGVAVGRSVDLVVALLGILKAGGAFVPLGLDEPPARLAELLADARPRAVVTTAERLDAFGVPGVAVSVPPPAVARARVAVEAGHLAYMLYTSGSTGKPKGVMVEHRQATSFFAEAAGRIPHDAGSAWLAVTRLAFDPAILELLWPLTRGLRLEVGPDGREVDAVAARLATAGITHLTGTPSFFRALLEQPAGRAALQGVRQLLVGGEALPPGLARALVEACPGEVWNMYGPTEATVDATGARVIPGDPRITIGKPLAHMRAFVVDPAGALLPPGVAGELWLGGPAIARGYWEQRELTAASFRPNPFGPGRVYRTGDRVRWLDDGRLEFLGRLDRQVKLRGFRLELGEVEAALRAHPAVREAAALVRTDSPGGQRLVGYVVADPDLDAASLRRHLGTLLPAHAVPAALAFLPALPCTANGKLDEAALPLPAALDGDAGRAPRTATEAMLAEVIGTQLGRGPVAVDRSFFELGGDSLAAIRLLARVEQLTGRQVPLRVFYDQPTAEALARALEEEAATTPDALDQAMAAHGGRWIRYVVEGEAHDVRYGDAPDLPARPAYVRSAAEAPRGGPAERALAPAAFAAALGLALQPPVLAPYLAAVDAGMDQLHAALAGAPELDRYPCGIHQALALSSGYRLAVPADVVLQGQDPATLGQAWTALVGHQALLRSTLEQAPEGPCFVEHAAPAAAPLPVLDLRGLAPAARASVRQAVGERLAERLLALPPTGSFPVVAAALRLNDRDVEVLVRLSQAVTDRGAGRILARLLADGGHGPAAVTGPYRAYVEACRRSLAPERIAAFKAGEAFQQLLGPSLALQPAFPAGVVHSPAWRVRTPLDAEGATRPLDQVLAQVAAVLAALTGTAALPLRVLVNRRLDDQARHYLTLGDFHDSVPVLLPAGAPARELGERFERADRAQREGGLHASSMGIDAEILAGLFGCPFNLNFIGDLAEAEERAVLAELAPLAFVAYPVLAYMVGARLELVLLHGLPAGLEAPVREALAALGATLYQGDSSRTAATSAAGQA